MFKIVTAATLSLSLALGSLTATPAQAADVEDIAPILFGAGLLAVLASSVRDRDDDRRVSRSAPARYRPDPRGFRVIEPADRGHAVARKNGGFRRILPSQCARTVRFANGNRTFLMKRCLENKNVRTARLPDRCERVIDMPGKRKDRTGWRNSCLKREGYIIR